MMLLLSMVLTISAILLYFLAHKTIDWIFDTKSELASVLLHVQLVVLLIVSTVLLSLGFSGLVVSIAEVFKWLY